MGRWNAVSAIAVLTVIGTVRANGKVPQALIPPHLAADIMDLRRTKTVGPPTLAGHRRMDVLSLEPSRHVVTTRPA